jgi:hypothetical protein
LKPVREGDVFVDFAMAGIWSAFDRK